ncbi:flagellar protein FlhE [Buttiauxella agrestis]|uniref:FlhE family flagellar protein n=1 Tax=Buttiauxella agrestis ATCC 33320 TaxID=1006004 RepID=A0A085GCW8_9ENTR|nr:flagellar protein FlhE [Buttiauxella agrestis]KFC81563.1 FlhE family flagellar protein [Buttiauxella agrestis ATCC 33320]
MNRLLMLMLLPFMAHASGEGAWQASGVGATLSHRGVAASSRALAPSQPVTGVMTMVAWRYELIGPTPAGLNVRLCSSTRCVEIEGQSGTTRGLTNVAANEPLRFVWQVPGGGALFPALKVQSNQVIVNYK